jgi:hypothetical protein
VYHRQIETANFSARFLGIVDDEDELSLDVSHRPINDVTAGLLRRMASQLHEVSAMPGGIEASDLPQVYKEFEEFRQGSDWLGFHSLRSLTQAIIGQRDDLVVIEDDPWRVGRAPELAPTQVPATTLAAPATRSEVPAGEVRAAAAEWLQQIVRSSQTAVTMAALAQAMTQRFSDQIAGTEWLGAGTFKNLLAGLDLGNLEMSPVVPGYVYDPLLHQAPTAEQAESPVGPMAGLLLDAFSLRHGDLAPLAQKVHQLTDTPYLIPEHYALLLRELAREINERGYQMTRTSKTVRDRCVERGVPVARSHVNFVLVGIGYTGHRFGHEQQEDAPRLGEALVQNTINLCRTAQFYPSDDEVVQIRRWILGSLTAEVTQDPA